MDIVKSAFMKQYFDENKTYNGCQAAWEWWRDPRLECLILKAGRPSAKRCAAPCKTCRTNVQKR